MFAHERGVLGLEQGIVMDLPRAGLGEIDAPLVQHLGQSLVDVFGAVVAVKAADGEGERSEGLL